MIKIKHRGSDEPARLDRDEPRKGARRQPKTETEAQRVTGPPSNGGVVLETRRAAGGGMPPIDLFRVEETEGSASPTRVAFGIFARVAAFGIHCGILGQLNTL